jgi:hypothetical protein
MRWPGIKANAGLNRRNVASCDPIGEKSDQTGKNCVGVEGTSDRMAGKLGLTSGSIWRIGAKAPLKTNSALTGAKSCQITASWEATDANFDKTLVICAEIDAITGATGEMLAGIKWRALCVGFLECVPIRPHSKELNGGAIA